MLPIPDGPEKLTPDWLTEALRGSETISEASVLSVRIDPTAVRKGNLGRLDRIIVEYDRVEPGAPASMIAKFHPPEIELRKFVAEANLTEADLSSAKKVAGASVRGGLSWHPLAALEKV